MKTARVVLTFASTSLLTLVSTFSFALSALLATAAPAMATPILGAAQGFSVLGAATVTNTGTTKLLGDLGVSPGTSITGQASIALNGSIHLNDGIVQTAQNDAFNLYNNLAGKAVTANLSSQDLGGLVLTPGVYFFASSAQLTGHLQLDAQNDPNALFVFLITSALTTASNSSVGIVNGGANNGIYWHIGSSATLGTGSDFAGNILADQSITFNTNASLLCGRAIALHAAVTMDSNTIYNDCNRGIVDPAHSDFGSAGFSGFGELPSNPVSEPTSPLLYGIGLLSWFLLRRKYQ